MLGEIEVLEVQLLFKQGKSLKAIARETGYSINTVRKYARDNSEPGYAARAARRQKLDDFREYIKERVKIAYPAWLPATVLFNELKSHGYTGSISLLRSYVRTLKPEVKERPLIRFETEPGEQMQVDFAHFKHNLRQFYAFVAVLGYSRISYVRFVDNQRIDTVISCHEDAFDYFGGVVRTGLYDNMKSIIISRNAYGNGNHKLHSTFYDFAKHYGFIPRICKPYNPQTKGKVERMISYLRYSFYNPFIAGKKAVSLDELNIAVIDWLNNIANKRVHGTTNQTPLERWVIEKNHLLNIPNNYSTNYGITDALSITQQSKNIMEQNIVPLQHDLSVYEELLSGASL